MSDTQKLDKYFYGTGDGTSPELVETGTVTYIPVQCNRDHCTPEERAVIEAALELSKGFFRTGDFIWRGPLYSNEAEDRFVTAAWQLLAARAGREKKDDSISTN